MADEEFALVAEKGAALLAMLGAKNLLKPKLTKASKPSPPEIPAPVKTTPAAKLAQLPIWPEAVRGVPNSVLRSALFGAVKRGRRAYMMRVPVASVDGVEVIQTGPRLDQADLDVWEQCLQLARTGGLGVRIQFTAHGFLNAIERGTGKSQHEWLKDALLRLATTAVEIKDGKKTYFGPMIHHGTRDDETGQYVIEMNPAILALYGGDGWSQIEWQERFSLKKNQLAQWLHGFYSTHAAPFPMKVETIHRLCGSEAKLLKHFRAELKVACERLETVTQWRWQIDESDLLRIDKSANRPAVQGRHLMKKITSRK